MNPARAIKLLQEDPSEFLYRATRNSVTNSLEDVWLDLTAPSSDEIVNRIDVRIMGMRRSGNHAIIEALIECAEAAFPDEVTMHLNDIRPRINGYRSRHQFPAKIDKPEYTAEMGVRRKRVFSPTSLLIRSYEDWSLDSFCSIEPQKYYGRSRDTKEVVILRDPYNLFASRMKSGKMGTKEGIDDVALYIEHFHAAEHRPGLIEINFDKWLRDASYRAGRLKALGLPEEHELSTKPSPRGGGSSFSGTQQEIDPNAVNRRWVTMKDDPAFRTRILENSDLTKIVETSFPEVLA